MSSVSFEMWLVDGASGVPWRSARYRLVAAVAAGIRRTRTRYWTSSTTRFNWDPLCCTWEEPTLAGLGGKTRISRESGTS